MSATYLCVGGPLDGQYRAAPVCSVGFQIFKMPSVVELRAAKASAPTVMPCNVIEYLRSWDEDRNCFVWRYAE